MDRHPRRLDHLATRFGEWLAPRGVGLLRLSVGLVFLGFGLLKFFPGLSPAEELVERTVGELTFGMVPDRVGLMLVAAMESAIGLCLLTKRYLRVGLALLGLAMVGILSPLVLLPEELFRGHAFAPTLAGQYVLKDIVLLAAGLVIAARALGARKGSERDKRPRDLDPAPKPSEPGRRRDRAAA